MSDAPPIVAGGRYQIICDRDGPAELRLGDGRAFIIVSHKVFDSRDGTELGPDRTITVTLKEMHNATDHPA